MPRWAKGFPGKPLRRRALFALLNTLGGTPYLKDFENVSLAGHLLTKIDQYLGLELTHVASSNGFSVGHPPPFHRRVRKLWTPHISNGNPPCRRSRKGRSGKTPKMLRSLATHCRDGAHMQDLNIITSC